MHLELGLSPLLERRLFHSCGFMYKIRNGLIKAEKLVILFEEIEITHGRDTRASHRGDLAVTQTRTCYGERAIQIFGCRTWNLLSVDLRSCKTFETFCRNYWKQHGN